MGNYFKGVNRCQIKPVKLPQKIKGRCSKENFSLLVL